jgi:fused signal recognition particle receptor
VRFWRKKPAEQALETADEAVATAEPEVEFAPTQEEIAEVHEQTERAVERTRRGFFGRLGGLFERADFTEDLWDELEEILIGADAGLPTTTVIVDAVKKRVKDEGVKQSSRVRDILREELVEVLLEPADEPLSWLMEDAAAMTIVLVVGVNRLIFVLRFCFKNGRISSMIASTCVSSDVTSTRALSCDDRRRC